MPYKPGKLFFIALALLLLNHPVHSQVMNRWFRVPFVGKPAITRHELHLGDQAGQLFMERFEKTPAKALKRMLRKNFPELWPKKSVKDDSIDTSESTLLLESLQLEADEYKRTSTATAEIGNASAPVSLF